MKKAKGKKLIEVEDRFLNEISTEDRGLILVAGENIEATKYIIKMLNKSFTKGDSERNVVSMNVSLSDKDTIDKAIGYAFSKKNVLAYTGNENLKPDYPPHEYYMENSGLTKCFKGIIEAFPESHKGLIASELIDSLGLMIFHEYKSKNNESDSILINVIFLDVFIKHELCKGLRSSQGDFDRVGGLYDTLDSIVEKNKTSFKYLKAKEDYQYLVDHHKAEPSDITGGFDEGNHYKDLMENPSEELAYKHFVELIEYSCYSGFEYTRGFSNQSSKPDFNDEKTCEIYKYYNCKHYELDNSM